MRAEFFCCFWSLNKAAREKTRLHTAERGKTLLLRKAAGENRRSESTPRADASASSALPFLPLEEEEETRRLCERAREREKERERERALPLGAW